MSEWISVKEKLPEPAYPHQWLVWIPSDTKAGGYLDIAAYGDYRGEVEDLDTNDPHYVTDNDDGNYRGSGWHREEETHGGPYDTIFVDLNGKVSHWMPLPGPPEAQP